MKPNFGFTVSSVLGWLRGQSPVFEAVRGRRTLDVGCGEGDLLARDRANFVGVDSNPAQVARLQAKGLAAQVGDVTALGFPDASFEAVSCRNVIEHLTPDQAYAMCREIVRVLQPGGTFALVTPMPATIWNTFGHTKPYPPTAIAKLLRPVSRESFEPLAGLAVEKLMYLGRGRSRAVYALTTALALFVPACRGSYLMVLRKTT